jgi:DNA-binding transcriptional regulator YiaG
MKTDTERRQINAEWIKALRKQLGLTQTQFAERLGVSLPSITRWELKQFRPTKLAANALLHLAASVSDGQPEKRSSGTKKPKKAPKEA